MEAEAREQKRRLVLKFGDVVTLDCLDFQGFASADTKQTPQARVEELLKGVEAPSNLKDCRFEVRQRYQYSSKKAYTRELERLGHGSTTIEQAVAFQPGNLSFTWFGGLQDIDESVARSKNSAIASRKPTQSTVKRIGMLREASAKEQRGNEDEFTRLVGEPVLYGQVIQLLHVTSRKFLTIKRTAADVERGALKVVLFDGGTQGSWFNLMSGFRTKMEGDKCLFGDLIELESSTFNGMGLHVSVIPITAPNMLPVNTGCYVQQSWELTATPDVAQWKLIPHSLHSSLIPGRLLEGYSAVKLVHKTSDNVMMYKNGGIVFQSTVSTGLQGNGIFEIEPVDVRWCGMPVKFEIWVRLRNLVTSQYLCGGDGTQSSEKGEVSISLSESYSSPGCVWKLRAFGQGDAELMEESFAYISNQHGQWISQGQALVNEKNSQEAIADTYMAVMRPECLEKDLIAICKVDSGYVEKLIVVRHCLDTVQSFLDALKALPALGVTSQDRPQDIKLAANKNGLLSVFLTKYPMVEMTLGEMMENLQISEPLSSLDSVIVYQTLARETRLIDVLIGCLAAINFPVFFGDAKNTSIGRQIVKFGSACHKFLQHCCVDNKANQSYIANRQDLLKSHLGGPVKAADTLAAIYDNNMEQIQNVEEDIIASFTELITKTGFKPRYINFLRTICGTPDRPVPKNQNLLICHLFKDPQKVFFSAEPTIHNPSSILGVPMQQETFETWMLHVLRDGKVTDIDCAEFAGYTDDVTKPDIFSWERSEAFLHKNEVHGLYIYYIFTLHLFSALCFGRNISAHEELLRASAQHRLGLEFPCVFSVVRNTRLPFTLRSAALDLCVALYIDVDPYHIIKLPKMTRVLWETKEVMPGVMDGGAETKWATASGVNVNTKEQIDKLAQSLVEYIGGTARMVVDEKKSWDNEGHAFVQTQNVEMDLTEHLRLQNVTENSVESEMDAKSIPIGEALDGECLDVGSDGVRALTLKVVVALEMMYKLGILAFDHPNTRRLLPDLLVVMGNVHQEGTDTGGLIESTSTTVIEVKKAVLRLLEFTLDLQMEKMLGDVFKGFAEYHQNVLEPDLDEDLGEDDMDLEGFDIEEEPKQDNISLLKKATSIKVVPFKRPAKKKAMKSIVNRLVKQIHSSQGHGFPLFKFDPFEYKKLEGPVVDLIGLVVYDCPSLSSQAFGLIERLLSKRKKFLEVVVHTHIIPDEDSTALFRASQRLLDDLRHWYRWVGSTNESKRNQSIKCCKAYVEELTKLVTPGSTVNVAVDGVSKEVIITKAKAVSFQSVLFDSCAHEVMLSFLKLPLRKKAQVDDGSTGPKMDQADDIPRRELFGLCYMFLKSFNVVTAFTQSIPNDRNQRVSFDHIDLFLSHTGTQNLNVADTISSLFKKNVVLASHIRNEVLQKFVKLIVNYGEKKRARWLRFLRSIIVVDGTPIKENQAAVLRLAAQYKDQFCSFFNGSEAEKRERLDLMKEEEHLKNKEEGANAQGSKLSYHQECVQLLAECCIGKDTTSIVKASDFLRFEDITETLLLHGVPGVKAETTRYLCASFWKFLEVVYLATDTESTRKHVRAANNKVWPPSTQRLQSESLSIDQADAGTLTDWASEQAHGGGSAVCLIDVVLEELLQSENEPKDALLSRTSSTSSLASHVFPALREYFNNHYLQHLAYLPESHANLMTKFVSEVNSYTQRICNIDAGVLGVKQERAAAVAAARSLLKTISDVTGVLGVHDYTVNNCSDSVSQQTGASAMSIKHLSMEWGVFYTAIGRQLGVHISEESGEPIEERDFKDFRVRYASLFLLSHLLTQPWGTKVPDTHPTIYFEMVVRKLADLMAFHIGSISWSEALLCKMIRALRAAIHMDDGRASSSRWKLCWTSVIEGKPVDWGPEHEQFLKWAQWKYNQLGITRAAVVLVGHSSRYIQLEAIQLLNTLLEGGNVGVQDALHAILSTGDPESVQFFSTLKMATQRCTVYVRAYAKKKPGKKGNANQQQHAGIGERTEEDVYCEVSEEDDEGDDECWDQQTFTLNNADNDFCFTMDAMRCLQVELMAEGHHTNNQKLLCSQPANPVNHDMIGEGVHLLMSIQNGIMESLAAGNTENPRLMIRIFEFLQEMVQGPCPGNQAALVLHTSFLLVCNRIFGYMDYNTEEGSTKSIVLKSNMKVHLLFVLYSALEGVTDSDIPTRMLDVLDMNAIQSQVKSVFSLLGLGGPQLKDVDAEINQHLKRELLQYVFFLEKLDTCLRVNEKQQQREDPLGFIREEGDPSSSLKLKRFIEQNRGAVEVMWDGKIERAFFELSPVCQKLAESRVWKRGALETLRSISPDSRSNPVLKGIELVNAMERIVHEIDLESHFLDGKGVFLLPVIKQRKALQESAAYIAVCILVLLGLTYGRSEDEWKQKTWSVWLVNGLCLLEVLLTSLVSLIFYLHDFKKLADLSLLDSSLSNFARLKELQNVVKETVMTLGHLSGEGNASGGEFGPGLSVCVPKPPPPPSETDKKIVHLEMAFVLLSYWKTWYILALLFATIGSMIHSPFYLTFHLTFFFVEFEAGKMMMEALSKSGTAILRTAILGILSILMFAVVTFIAFNDNLGGDTRPCSTFFQCTGSHLIAGIYGDISTLFTEHLPSDVPDKIGQNGHQQIRSVFIVAFFMFWTFMLSNIFTGLIADAFGAIRDDKNTVQTDSDSKCLVCSLDRFKLDSCGQGFEHHIEHEHNPLAYVFYLHHLRSTPPDQYTGYDSCVMSCMEGDENVKANWLPVGRAFALEHIKDGEIEERNKVITRLDHLWHGLKAVEARLQAVEEKGNEKDQIVEVG